MERTRPSLRRLMSSYWSIRPEDRRNQWIATGLLFVWAVAFVGTAILIKRGVVPAGAPTYLMALVPTALGVLAVLAYMRFLRRADELLRRIQLGWTGMRSHLEAAASGCAFWRSHFTNRSSLLDIMSLRLYILSYQV